MDVLKLVSTGEVFGFDDKGASAGAFMAERGLCHSDVEWLATEFWAVTWAENMAHWNLGALRPDPEWPMPVGIEGFGFLIPQPVHLCSATASQFVEVVEYRAVWADGVEVPDDCAEWWNQELLSVGRDDLCLDYRRAVGADGRPSSSAFTAVSGPWYVGPEDGESETERAGAMREFCQSNPPI